MPNTRIIATVGAGSYVDITASIPCHYLSVCLDGDRNAVGLDYKVPDDSFATVFQTDPTSGDIIERIGPGRSGFLGVPASFARSGQAATTMLKVKCSDNSVKNLRVFESEHAL